MHRKRTSFVLAFWRRLLVLQRLAHGLVYLRRARALHVVQRTGTQRVMNTQGSLQQQKQGKNRITGEISVAKKKNCPLFQTPLFSSFNEVQCRANYRQKKLNKAFSVYSVAKSVRFDGVEVQESRKISRKPKKLLYELLEDIDELPNIGERVVKGSGSGTNDSTSCVSDYAVQEELMLQFLSGSVEVERELAPAL